MGENAQYLLVEGEPWLSMVKAWRESVSAAHKAGYDYVRSLGATYGVENGRSSGLTGVGLVNPAPLGWKVIRGLRGKPDYMVPNIKARDKTARAAAEEAKRAFDAVLRPLPLHPIAEALGVQSSVSYEVPGGSKGSMSAGYGFFFSPIQILWFGDTYVIYAPDTGPTIQKLREDYPDVVITHGEWSPPAGVRAISEARYNLMVSQWKVEREEAGDPVEDDSNGE
ncbi:hypothetical protein [Roseomonas xinghualingensis]|uniref:hypothetical protein n=1 Tax=Roseomonas xinghualingensis TaxID=2986475 RepID=UPI0021F1FFB1|nr:hypothetical protein [Roseomonas sp. SXEYE001]MCV4208590.1 hypothetical protein [Roseomonas sp. SXEYE001]